jgi:phospholipase C
MYDYLGGEYCVCDRWFCSVPGATWPNRLYALTGQSQGRKDPQGKVPWYDLPSFPRYLDRYGVSWRWYTHDVATLRFSDGRYRLGHAGNFTYFDRRSLLNRHSFLDDAAAGRLPAVSWIDPNFVDVRFIGPSSSNDDHPPSDVMAGQELVLKLYNALRNSPQWDSTLLVITYDEHGGFYDHVPAPRAPDELPHMRRYGPRVPALIVSPLVARKSVSSVVFDHTSIVKTILLRFCRHQDGSIPDMGRRVNEANHLGPLLLPAPRATPSPASYKHVVESIAKWRAGVFQERIQAEIVGEPLRPPPLNELQEGYLKARQRLREQGLPEDQP